MVKTAAAQNIEPQGRWPISMVASFQNFWKEIGITNDDFIRTTGRPAQDRRCRRSSADLWQSDDIYLGSYEGWYDEGQEEFVTETEAKTREYKSVISGRPSDAVFREELFLPAQEIRPAACCNTSKQNPDFIQPAIRRNEVLSKLKQGVEDLSISRATLKWGIPLPQRSGSRGLRLDRRAEQLHHRSGLCICRRIAVREILAGGCAPHRQGNPLVPHRLLAGDAVFAESSAAEESFRPRLVDQRPEGK